MRNVVLVAEQQLQSVHGAAVSPSLGLSEPEMQMIEVIRDRLVHRGQRRVNQEMVVAGIRLVDTSRRDPHPDEAKRTTVSGGRRVHSSG